MSAASTAAASPRVSVVTPFYNTADYLAQCIESVLAQTFEDWEYVLVDNRSTDGSREIAERYARTDPRIRVVENPRFVGQVENYNGALRQISSHSRYCKIVQADDWIHPDCLRAMVDVADAHPNVALVGAYSMVGTRPSLIGLRFPQEVFPGAEVCRLFLQRGVFVFGSPTSVMMRADVVRARDPFYRLDSPFEDVDICFDLLRDHDFGFVHQVLTYTRRDNDSIMTRIAPYKPFLLMRLLMLARHGRAFLSEDEYRACRRATLRAYYGLLGESVLRMRPRGFWAFHRDGLASEGLRLNGWAVAGHAVLAALDLIFNPVHSARRVLDARARSRGPLRF